MEISGAIPLFLAGVLGALLHEGLKVFAAYQKDDTWPAQKELLGSLVFVVLGGLVPLIYGTDERPFLEAAQLAVGVPALISAGFKVSSAGTPPSGNRTVTQYLGWTF